MPKEIQNNSGSLSSKHRLAQIIAILKKHHLTKGIDPVKLRMILEDLGPTFVKIEIGRASCRERVSIRV